MNIFQFILAMFLSLTQAAALVNTEPTFMATQIQLVLALGVTVREEPIQMALHVFRQVFTVIRKNLKNTLRSHTQKKKNTRVISENTYIP